MSDSKTFPLFAPAATVNEAIGNSSKQSGPLAAQFMLSTCRRDIRHIADLLENTARGMVVCREPGEELRMAVRMLELWLSGGMEPATDTTPDYSHEDQTEREIEEDRAALACRDCDRPAYWGRTRDGVCRACHEEARRDPSADTEDPSVRGY